uniref:AlNc14C116G6529 protein n=1 Tax=Albugo laibachii Nc14 TaxID=890382 RepID=F0W057_9STRA|nr:AlNc14C3G525 [Albugo laibachii Nc14]CCA21239.1 AlNc14C116G6529 [Albugo laibachii Nc14]|eukprot:CCA21239.1 AlNc14C116G6529 [Albugo laibachii Nc14]
MRLDALPSSRASSSLTSTEASAANPYVGGRIDRTILLYQAGNRTKKRLHARGNIYAFIKSKFLAISFSQVSILLKEVLQTVDEEYQESETAK